MSKLLILGATSYLGAKFNHYKNEEYNIIKVGRKKNSDIVADITNLDQLLTILFEVAPDSIINFIANTNVEECEQSLASCLQVNTIPNIAIARYAYSREVRVIHISSDMVYNSDQLSYEIEANPLNNYAFSKVVSENVLLNQNSVSIRTNFFGRSLPSFKQSYTDWIYNKLINGEKIYASDEIYFNPLWDRDLVTIIELLIKNIAFIGKLNVGARGVISKFEFCKKFAQLLSLNESLVINGASSNKVIRPRNMTMSLSLLESILDERQKTITESLKECIEAEYR